MGGMTERSTSAEHRKNYINNPKQLKPMSVFQIVFPIVLLIVVLILGRHLMNED